MLAVFVMMALPAAAQDRSRGRSGRQDTRGGSGTHASAGVGWRFRVGGESLRRQVRLERKHRPSGGGSASSRCSGRADAGGRHSASGGSGVAVRACGGVDPTPARGRHGDGGSVNGGTVTPGRCDPGDPRDTTAGPTVDACLGQDRRLAAQRPPGDGTVTGADSRVVPGSGPIVGTAVPRGSVAPPPPAGGERDDSNRRRRLLSVVV